MMIVNKLIEMSIQHGPSESCKQEEKERKIYMPRVTMAHTSKSELKPFLLIQKKKVLLLPTKKSDWRRYPSLPM